MDTYSLFLCLSHLGWNVMFVKSKTYNAHSFRFTSLCTLFSFRSHCYIDNNIQYSAFIVVWIGAFLKSHTLCSPNIQFYSKIEQHQEDNGAISIYNRQIRWFMVSVTYWQVPDKLVPTIG